LPICNDFLKQGTDHQRGHNKFPPEMYTFLTRLIRDDRGATAIEYGLIAALIAVAAVTVMGTVGTNLKTTFSTVASHL
jgi:pilus assembly protein Flp/PilA